jgi:hypothetical protein
MSNKGVDMSPRQLTDASVLGGLLLVLLLVVVTDKLLPTPATVTPSPQARPVISTQPGQSAALRLAVTPSYQDKVGAWDDMAKLLSTLGEGYKYTLVPVGELYNPKRFEAFDVLFLTCAPGGDDPALTGNLRNFVSQGGTLYASDWRYECVAMAFPDMVAGRLRNEGQAQSVDARVVDPGLRDQLGETVPLRFDLDRWKPAAFSGDRVKVLLEGSYYRQSGGKTTAPLLVKFQFGKGTVIFTSFHNEKQNSAVEQKLLKYLVFSAVTAQIENEVNQTLIQGGFAPQKQNLLSASLENPKVSYSYRSTKAGKIRFVLGFDNRGAKLRLTVTTPDGKKIEQEGTSTFVVEALSRGPANWQYTVTALSVPREFSEFPFNVTVAESE